MFRMHRAVVAPALAALALASAAAHATRVEETNPVVTYTIGWTADAAEPWSGGTAVSTNAPGARARLNFTGTSATWIGGRAPDTGIARIYLDGAFVRDVDTYSKTHETRVTQFTLSGATNAPHTLEIEATGLKNANATGARVVVDAFDVPAVTIARYQETDQDASFSVGWVQDNPVVAIIPGFTTGRTQGSALRDWSGNGAKLTTLPGARATFEFSGTGIAWIGARGTQTGIARVYLDGQLMGDVDLYSAQEKIQAAVFTAGGLADGAHVLVIEATGAQNPAAQGALVVVDAFEVTHPGTRRQEYDAGIVYTAGWIQDNRDKAYSEGATAESVTPGARATFTFTGTGVSWVGARGPQTGIARVYLDGALAQVIDTYSPGEAPQKILFTATGLAPGAHTIAIEHTGQKNALSTDTWILVDAFDVIP